MTELQERDRDELSIGPPGTERSAPTQAGPADPNAELTYQYGLEIEARSQWAYARRRFVRHKLALGSLFVLLAIFACGAFANFIAPYTYQQINLESLSVGPSKKHIFGTDSAGRDSFSRVLYGIRTSARVGVLVGVLSTVIGTIIGGLAGYYGGWMDNLLMRVTDLFLTLPLLAVLLVSAKYLGHSTPGKLALLLAFLIWTQIARIVRGSFLSLREKEYIEAAKAAGAGDLRIMLRHMLPNTVGPIVVSATLTIGTAILLEATLSFLGFGIEPPTPALGALLNEGQDQGIDKWWLVTFPGVVIVIIVLCINFVGDGLRDALDPTQRRVRA
jgi:ABC-type dipeptide/oligopeptide/nickel transport system permease subunit